jgi:iron complex outermembrane receptor protein
VLHANDRGSTFKLLYGEAFRSPNTLELAVNQPAAALLSNPDLRPERIRTFEGVWEQQMGRLATTVSLSHNEIRDLINLVSVALPDSLIEYGRLAFQQQNLSTARSVAFELEARAALSEGTQARLGYSYSYATDRDTGERLINAPAQQLKVNVRTSLGRHASLAVALRAESERSTLYGTVTRPGSVIDLTVTSRPLFAGLTAQASVTNVFDRQYGVPGGFQHVMAVIPQPRRRATLRIGYGW